MWVTMATARLPFGTIGFLRLFCNLINVDCCLTLISLLCSMRDQSDACVQHILAQRDDLPMFTIAMPFSVNNMCSHDRPVATILSLIGCVFNYTR